VQELIAKGPKSSYALIDVREPDECAAFGVIPSAHNIPLGQLPAALLESPADWQRRWGWNKPAKDTTVVVYCRSGRRSELAANVLMRDGFTNVRNYKGSALEWFQGKA